MYDYLAINYENVNIYRCTKFEIFKDTKIQRYTFTDSIDRDSINYFMFSF